MEKERTLKNGKRSQNMKHVV